MYSYEINRIIDLVVIGHSISSSWIFQAHLWLTDMKNTNSIVPTAGQILHLVGVCSLWSVLWKMISTFMLIMKKEVKDKSWIWKYHYHFLNRPTAYDYLTATDIFIKIRKQNIR